MRWWAFPRSSSLRRRRQTAVGHLNALTPLEDQTLQGLVVRPGLPGRVRVGPSRSGAEAHVFGQCLLCDPAAETAVIPSQAEPLSERGRNVHNGWVRPRGRQQEHPVWCDLGKAWIANGDTLCAAQRSMICCRLEQLGAHGPPLTPVVARLGRRFRVPARLLHEKAPLGLTGSCGVERLQESPCAQWRLVVREWPADKRGRDHQGPAVRTGLGIEGDRHADPHQEEHADGDRPG